MSAQPSNKTLNILISIAQSAIWRIGFVLIVVLVVNFDDLLTDEKDGFDADDPFSFKVWDANAGIDSPLKVQFYPNQPDYFVVFVADGISAISGIEFLNNLNGQSLSSVQLFPNPTRGKVKIVGIEEGTILKITVTNQTGQLVKTQTLDSDYQINLEDFTPGLHFIKLDDGRYVKYKKVVLE